MPEYLFYFTDNLPEFRAAEFESVAKICGAEVKGYKSWSRFIQVCLYSDDLARQIASRCVLLRLVIQLWSHGEDIHKLAQNLLTKVHQFTEHYVGSFRFDHHAIGRRNNYDHKLSLFKALSFLPFTGAAKMKDCDNIFPVIEQYETDSDQSIHLSQIYFGRLISEGQSTLAHKLNLERRVFIGNTSMDPLLSLLMANFAKINKHSLCFDPFAGTGSILVGAAAFGGRCVGSEINYMLVHAKAKPSRAKVSVRSPNESVRANFEQYNMLDKYLDILLADSSKSDIWRQQPLFDAIITDPPYGIREKCAKLGNKICRKEQDPDSPTPSFPQKQEYSPLQVFLDLLDFSAQYLVVGGRLVYWYPVRTSGFTEEMLPRHSFLQLLYNCEQKLSSNHSRRLLTMQKTRDYRSEIDVHASVVQNPYDSLSMRELVLGKNHMNDR